MGTLTGAARVALGPELPPFYTDDEALAGRGRAPRRGRERSAVAHAAVARPTTRCSIPRSPTSTTSRPAAWPARSSARCSSSASSRRRRAWLHFDIYAWTPSAKPGRPEGGECQAARALYALLMRALRLMARCASIRASLRRGPIWRRAHLRGKVEAARFVEGVVQEVIAGQAPLRSEPVARRAAAHRSADGRARHGLRDRRGRLGLGPTCRLTAMSAGCRRRRCWRPGRSRPTRSRRCARWCFPGPSIKLPPTEALPLGAQDRGGARGRKLRRHRRGRLSCRRGISRRSSALEPDFVAVAERFLGTPYLWGGKTSLGLDCSGLVQVALTACGIACPRDSDMQEHALGKSGEPRRPAARRPDVLERPRRHRARPRHA